MKLIHSSIHTITLLLSLYQSTSIIKNQNTCTKNESNISNESNITNETPYHGIDHSWPQHHHTVTSNERQNVYNHYINGCYKQSGKEACDIYERDRINMNVRQPQSVHVSPAIAIPRNNCL